METAEIDPLLEQALARLVSPQATMISKRSVAIQQGLSGAEVVRDEIVYREKEGGVQTLRLVAKKATLLERRVLAHLNRQRQPNVPLCFLSDSSLEEVDWVVMQDLGDQHRPPSLEPITSDALKREAMGLARIHAANFDQREALSWLPDVDQKYLEDYVLEKCWRPQWEQSLQKPGLAKLLEPFKFGVEHAARRLSKEWDLLLEELHLHTLIHTDINPSNVLMSEQNPFYIDWQAAHYGPFYIDLPHHFCTLEQAEHYRAALKELGTTVPEETFMRGYRIAARMIGFRYVWWTLAAWESEPEQTAWVKHYLNLIQPEA